MDNIKYFIAGALFTVTLLRILAKIMNSSSQDKRKK